MNKISGAAEYSNTEMPTKWRGKKPPSLRRHYPVQVLRVLSQPIQKESAPRELAKQPVNRLFHLQIYGNNIPGSCVV